MLKFCLLAFGISWLGWLPLFGDGSTYWHLYASLGPALAALLVATPQERQRILSALGNVRSTATGWAFALGFPLLLAAIAAAFASGDWSLDRAFSVAEYPNLPPLAILAAEILFYGFGEEIGWRGYLLPKLSQTHSPRLAVLYVGLIWAAWHLPLLLRNPTYRGLGAFLLLGWLFSMLVGSALMAWLWRVSAASLPVLAAFHGLLDVAMVSLATPAQAIPWQGAALTIAGLLAFRSNFASPSFRTAASDSHRQL